MFSLTRCIKCVIIILTINFIHTDCLELVVRPSERIKTVTSSYFVEGNLYVSEMITHLAVNECVNLCKAKKNCKFINFYSPANICYLIGVIGNVKIQKENYVETAPGFIFGAKEEWDMEEFVECEHCNNFGVCSNDGHTSSQKCLDSGCSPPVGIKNSKIFGHMYTIGNSIRGQCDNGYRSTVKDQGPATCMSDGTWSQKYRDCLTGIYDVNGVVYKISENIILDWIAAQEFCTEFDGNLVKIVSQQEQDILADIIRKNYNQICYWIGGRRNNGVLEWTDGELVKNGYVNMGHGQPDFDGDCIDLLSYFDYRWNDAACHAICNFICEFF